MHKQLNLLSTMPLTEAFIQEAATRGVTIDVRQFIYTLPVASDGVRTAVKQLSQTTATVIFTSQQAVSAVANQLDVELVNWTIYCTAGPTQTLISRLFKNSRIAGTATDAGTLADKILEGPGTDIIFFCGHRRREELPAKLASAKINMREVQVYETVATPGKITGLYHGILFYSPSGTESFFSVNTINSSTVLFAIGSTTATSLRNFSTNTIITGHGPGKQALAEQAIQYFDN